MDQFEGPVRQAECGGFYRYMPVTPCSVHVSLSTHSLGCTSVMSDARENFKRYY